MVLPGFPHLKLWPDSVESIGAEPKNLPRLNPDLDKRGHRVHDGFANKPVELRCIYILSVGDELELAPLSPRDAMLALMPHWYGARFGKEFVENLGIATHFQHCAGLANSVSVCSFRRPKRIEALQDHVRMIGEHLAQMPLMDQVAQLVEDDLSNDS